MVDFLLYSFMFVYFIIVPWLFSEFFNMLRAVIKENTAHVVAACQNNVLLLINIITFYNIMACD